jgi:hypothetical protein
MSIRETNPHAQSKDPCTPCTALEIDFDFAVRECGFRATVEERRFSAA